VNGSPPAPVDRWLSIDRDGAVHVFVGKVDLGTGIRTALAQIVADELDVPLDAVHVVEGQTGITPDQGRTVGSQSLQSGAPPLRAAAATARKILLERAAKQLGVGVERLVTRDGVVSVAGGEATQIAYGALAEGGFGREVDAEVPLRSAATYRWVGTSVPRVDLPDKVRGAFAFVHDIALPAMWHARLVRPPAVGARLVEVDATSIAGFPDVRIVREGDFLAVAARDQWRTLEAARTLVTRWSGGGLPDQSEVYERLRGEASTEAVTRDDGALDAAFAKTKAHEATYRWPFQSHGSLGPPCAVADVRTDGATIWCASQGVYLLRARLAELLALPEDAISVVYEEGSGCFGDNGTDEAAIEAARISCALGAPVRLQWTLAEQLGWDPKGPAMLSTLRGALRAGRIVGWEHAVWTPPHFRLHGAVPAPRADAVAGDRNATVDYAIGAQRVVVHIAPHAALQQSALRSLGAAHNVFANESFFDELAFDAGADPLRFRLDHLDDSRARAVLERVAELAVWRGGEPYTDGPLLCGRGIAFARYDGHGAYVAAITSCAVDTASGRIDVREIAIAHDCGLIVNPDGLRNQIEGNAIQATSRALLEEVHFDRERVTSTDWSRYPILRFPDAPTVRISLIDRPEQPALGAGEPTTIVIAPAIANAVFAATGVRLREVPFSAARYLAERGELRNVTISSMRPSDRVRSN
jgi:nicotinate dehydrogenase subunit B